VRVRWLRVALANLLEAAEYLERENPTVAAASLERIVKAVYRLEHYPGIGRAGRIEGTRELVVAGTPYVIPYRVRGNVIEILRVFHSARQWPTRL
jgi:toxin ParE1/3/4